MASDRLQSRADALAAKVAGLAAALHAAGVPEETTARVLSLASAAVLQVLTLELLLEQPSAVVTSLPQPEVDAGFRLAA